MNKIIKYLPEGLGFLVFILGMATIISKATVALQTNPNYKPDYIEAFVYVGAAFAVFVVLKVVQLICGELFKRNK